VAPVVFDRRHAARRRGLRRDEVEPERASIVEIVHAHDDAVAVVRRLQRHLDARSSTAMRRPDADRARRSRAARSAASPRRRRTDPRRRRRMRRRAWSAGIAADPSALARLEVDHPMVVQRPREERSPWGWSSHAAFPVVIRRAARAARRGGIPSRRELIAHVGPAAHRYQSRRSVELIVVGRARNAVQVEAGTTAHRARTETRRTPPPARSRAPCRSSTRHGARRPRSRARSDSARRAFGELDVDVDLRHTLVHASRTDADGPCASRRNAGSTCHTPKSSRESPC